MVLVAWMMLAACASGRGGGGDHDGQDHQPAHQARGRSVRGAPHLRFRRRHDLSRPRTRLPPTTLTRIGSPAGIDAFGLLICVLISDEVEGWGAKMAERDKELEAISSIIDLLKPLDAIERSRVLEYVLKRLDMQTVHALSAADLAVGAPELGTPRLSTVTDIRTLTAEKQPRSANEMVALIAYYLSELAPEGEARPTINVDAVRKYFKLAGFPMPRAPHVALPNSAAAGYLENVSRGEYRLNPVGYNLIVHGLPRSSSPVPGGVARRTVHKRKRSRK